MQLATAMSPWARLLDWLSYRYKILFVISAGNHSKALTYDFGSSDLISSPQLNYAEQRSVANRRS